MVSPPPNINGNPSNGPFRYSNLPRAISVPWYGSNPNFQDLKDITDAKKSFLFIPTNFQNEIFNAMTENYGELGVGWSYSDVQDGWGDAVDAAAEYRVKFLPNANDKQLYVHEAFINMLPAMASMGLKPNGSQARKSGSGGVSSSVSKSVSLTNESTARGLIDQTLSQYLGRSATSKEQDAFFKALNVQQKQNPTITRQTVSSGGGSTSAVSSTVGGFDPSTFAKEYAAGQEGVGEFQAATSLLDAFIGSLGAKV